LGRTIGVIQAHMSSRGLAGRILAPLAGRPLLAHLCARITAARVDDWWLATGSDPSDDVTEAWGFELGLRVFRGDGTDMLSRILAIASEARADWVLRVHSDVPFLDTGLLDRLLDARDGTEEIKRADVLVAREGLPIGYAVELVRRRALETASREIPQTQRHHRKHIGGWLSNHARIARIPMPADWPARPDWRWTVDTYQDLAMARSAFRSFGHAAATIDYPSMVACLDAHPEITGMNQQVADGGHTAW
jgi:spore coat polysaccharide biosynthesis protein SpsF (cytidylyltransferase family)